MLIMLCAGTVLTTLQANVLTLAVLDSSDDPSDARQGSSTCG